VMWGMGPLNLRGAPHILMHITCHLISSRLIIKGSLPQIPIHHHHPSLFYVKSFSLPRLSLSLSLSLSLREVKKTERKRRGEGKSMAVPGASFGLVAIIFVFIWQMAQAQAQAQAPAPAPTSDGMFSFYSHAFSV
jgi:hypothetical protein